MVQSNLESLRKKKCHGVGVGTRGSFTMNKYLGKIRIQAKLV